MGEVHHSWAWGEFPKMVRAVRMHEYVVVHAFVSLLVNSDGMFSSQLGQMGDVPHLPVLLVLTSPSATLP